jgi:hypothetical protein
MTVKTEQNFYHSLASFADFNGITEDQNFTAVPEDWKIVISDIKGSTEAIEKGQYKDVNTIGAASIVSAHNALGQLEFPYVFGGDGSTFLIPCEYQDKVERELIALKEISFRSFGLDLRIGIIDVKEILAEGASIEVAKFKLVGKKSVAIFRGGGITLAEHKLKTNQDKYAIKGRIKHMIDLKNLSCRWNAIPASSGKNLSMLVAVRTENKENVYKHILKHLNEIYEGKLEDANPVNIKKMSYKSFSQCFKNEKRLHTSIWSMAFIKRLVSIFLSVLMFKIGLPKKIYDPTAYTQSIKAHSDYRKFDDMLRMNIDCSPKQFDLIESYLKNLYEKKYIYYGLHTSDNSIMTCYVNDLNPGNHIHFIDGGNGGYAMAAKKLKAQQA